MNSFEFSEAKAVFVPFVAQAENAVNQYGFYSSIDLSESDISDKHIVIRLTARNVYRLYVNGRIAMHGPARTAHGYCRVDEVDVTGYFEDGVNHIAVEVMEYGAESDAYDRYSNDSTLEDGLFIAEIDIDGEIVSATGKSEWKVFRITERYPRSERISHSRECTEIYTLDDKYYLWKFGVGDFHPVALLEKEPSYLTHDALLPTLEESFVTALLESDACFIDENKEITLPFYENNSSYYNSLPEHPTEDCHRTVTNPDGSLRTDYDEDGLTLTPINTNDYYALWDCDESHVGFMRIAITCEKSGIVDLVHADFLDFDGTIPYRHNIVARLHVQEGFNEFVAMEPALIRYMVVYFRGTGVTTVHELSIIDYSYPDEHRATFLCSDENVNRIYKAAKKTLLLNTMDIFMDCPERERGGWLCDSLWTARAASLMLSDDRVEREHIENFLLTPSDKMFHGFFPEAYPAMKANFKDSTGITTWSFWLMCELCEYVQRTGDTAFRDKYKKRVSDFVEGTKDFIGKSGLIENMPCVFIDWSMSNYGEYQLPISTPANALYAYMLQKLGETFGKSEWTELGQKVKATLRNTITCGSSPKNLKQIPDGFNVTKEGVLSGNNHFSEAAIFTSLWCELFTAEEAPALSKTVRDKMGPAPIYAKDPNMGSSQLFIGLCIRLDMLCRLGYYEKMFEDLKAIYEPQLKEGPDTFWENQSIDTDSRCHGFTAHAGVHLMRDVLGIGFHTFEQNGDGKCTVEIAPHICGLRWAKGTHETAEGIINLSWKYDGESFSLKSSIPKSYSYKLTLPKEVRMLDDEKISITIKTY